MIIRTVIVIAEAEIHYVNFNFFLLQFYQYIVSCFISLNKSVLYRIILLLLIILILFCDYHILFAVIFSFFVIDFTRGFIDYLNFKYKISLKLVGILYVCIASCIVFFISKFLVYSFINQNSRLIEIINDKDFINEKISGLHGLFEKITEKILLIKQNVSNDLYNAKIDQLISNLPDIIISKSVIYLNLILEKSYLSGLKFIDFWYIFILSMVFLFYFIADLYKIESFFHIVLGDLSKRISSFIFYVKNIIFVIVVNQLKVSLILTFLYSIILYLLNFEYFFIYALCFSLFTLIPIFGSALSIILLSISCYIFDYSLSFSFKLFIVLFCGILLENLILTPKFVGKSINTHPLLIIIGIIVLPKFLGILGLIFTLPIVAILNDAILNIIERIKNNEKRLNG